ncbi:MAG: hypothetical protein KIT57_14860 [Blastocatellales bacterium]|nr:hypothetical protein [Blastocatellales bacterium]
MIEDQGNVFTDCSKLAYAGSLEPSWRAWPGIPGLVKPLHAIKSRSDILERSPLIPIIDMEVIGQLSNFAAQSSFWAVTAVSILVFSTLPIKFYEFFSREAAKDL